MSGRLRNLCSQRWVGAAIAVSFAAVLVGTGPAAADSATEAGTLRGVEVASAQDSPGDGLVDRGIEGGVWIIDIGG